MMRKSEKKVEDHKSGGRSPSEDTGRSPTLEPSKAIDPVEGPYFVRSRTRSEDGRFVWTVWEKQGPLVQPALDLPSYESASDVAYLLNQARHERKNHEQAQRLAQEVAEHEEREQS